ncbi:MAG: RpiB/LacA/LacB family sugar-phosphate isomerase, partial [Bacillota bacterium]|nr:RpiB/LacA/LacB family sugar-phosphate isomerase [Bacillota bacterium]
GEYVVSGKADLGIVCCGTGIGISIAANKVKGVRCANVTSKKMAALAKEHNHANILALGERILTKEEAFEFVDTWLSTEEGHDRHDVRVAMLNEM